MDVGGAAADPLGDLDGEPGVLLDELREHFREDELLGHRLGGDLDDAGILFAAAGKNAREEQDGQQNAENLTDLMFHCSSLHFFLR